MKGAQWREWRDGPSEAVGGHIGAGRPYENRTRRFVFFAEPEDLSFFFFFPTTNTGSEMS